MLTHVLIVAAYAFCILALLVTTPAGASALCGVNGRRKEEEQ